MSKSDVAKFKRFFHALGLQEHSIEKNESGGSPLSSSFKQDAEDFLYAAEDAFELAKYAAALTDAKRAIHCQIDEIMESLGYSWKRVALRKKLEIVRSCGFVAPRIINRVSAARNLLEHEYVNPSAAKASEALDIATLFVHATRRHLDGFMDEFYVGDSAEKVDTFHFRKELAFSFDAERKKFRISACTDVQPERYGLSGKTIGELSVGADSELFPALVKLTLAGQRDEKIILAFHDLFGLVRRSKQ
jgi:hypothetical protein